MAALVQKKFLPEFQKWQQVLTDFGYVNFVQLLNAKDHEVAQNRLRVFAVSIHDDGDDPHFTFPTPIPLTKCIADYLEPKVDESFFIKEDRMENMNLEFYETEDGDIRTM